MAGLAYDAHPHVTSAPITTGRQTITLTGSMCSRSQTYVSKNQYWLTAKYGGFAVPDTGFDPYAAGNSPRLSSAACGPRAARRWAQIRGPTTTLSRTTPLRWCWDCQGRSQRSSPRTRNRPVLAFATPTPKIASTGSGTYATSYDPRTWSGDVEGSLITFDASGNPTLTPKWNAASLLDATAHSSRKIVTCCTSSGAALPFQANLLTPPRSARGPTTRRLRTSRALPRDPSPPAASSPTCAATGRRKSLPVARIATGRTCLATSSTRSRIRWARRACRTLI